MFLGSKFLWATFLITEWQIFLDRHSENISVLEFAFAKSSSERIVDLVLFCNITNMVIAYCFLASLDTPQACLVHGIDVCGSFLGPQ